MEIASHHLLPLIKLHASTSWLKDFLPLLSLPTLAKLMFKSHHLSLSRPEVRKPPPLHKPSLPPFPTISRENILLSHPTLSWTTNLPSRTSWKEQGPPPLIADLHSTTPSLLSPSPTQARTPSSHTPLLSTSSASTSCYKLSDQSPLSLPLVGQIAFTSLSYRCLRL